MRNGLIKKYSILFTLGVYIASTFLQSFSFLNFNKVYAQGGLPQIGSSFGEQVIPTVGGSGGSGGNLTSTPYSPQGGSTQGGLPQFNPNVGNGQNTQNLNPDDVSATVPNTNLVAIFVDDQIYGSLENNIKRYAKTYIQGSNKNQRHNAISNSKAIVLPIDVNNVTAPEITKILENMYLDGISGEPSKLVGVILIGDIPLPVVNQNGFIYPTIYPYVDFEKQKFIWDDSIKYFVYNNNPKGQAEIWHGLINFDTIDEYNAYFDKLKTYSQNPGDFVDKSIWYEDIIANKKYFLADGLGSYINKFLFAEDIGQKRYSDLMMKIMQGTYNDVVADIAEGLNADPATINAIKSTTDNMNTPTKFIDKMVKEGFLTTYTSLMGTRHLDRIVKNVETANRRIEPITGSDGSVINRTALDTSYSTIEQKDEALLRMDGGIDPLIIAFNNALEKIVDDKIEQEKYRLNEVVPLTYLKYQGYKKNWQCTWSIYSAYENYFFGKLAKEINNMQETSTYRGTYRNFDNIIGLKISHIQAGAVPSSDLTTIDLNKKSVGGSYDIFATQIDANRGYNINNTIRELDVYETSKIAKREHRSTRCQRRFLGICWQKRKWQASEKKGEECELSGEDYEQKQGGCEDPQEFAIRIRGGASPLNLSGTNQWTSGYSFQDATLPIFDIGGSTMLLQPQNNANSFLGVNTYSRLIQRTFVPIHESNKDKYYFKNKDKEKPDLYGFGYNPNMGEDMKFTNQLPKGDLDEDDVKRTKINPFTNSDVDFFKLFKYNTVSYKAWEGDIFKLKKIDSNDECLGEGEIFTYKTLDSRVKNVASTNVDLYGSVYKVFEDDISPSKKFYETLSGKLNSAYSLVYSKTSSSTGSVVHKMNQLKTYVNNIKNSVWNIYNTELNPNWSADDISNLTTQRNSAITWNILNNVENMVNNVQNGFVDLYTFIHEFGYEHIIDYIENQLYNAKVNGDSLIFLKTWKNNLAGTMNNINSQYLTIGSVINNSENIYNQINELEKIRLKNRLQWKRDEVEEKMNGGKGCNSNSKFKPLCDTLETLKEIIDSRAGRINDKIKEIEKFDPKLYNDGKLEPFEDIFPSSSVLSGSSLASWIINNLISSSNNPNLTGYIPGINNTTSDRPIDSPKYITFKGIGGNKVTFIYPNLYKAEIFTGNDGFLELKNPEEIEFAIKQYLIETVKKYNEYLIDQNNKKHSFYQQNSGAYDALRSGDKLASPVSLDPNTRSYRPYGLMPDNYLIVELENKLRNNAFFNEKMGGYEPIEFIAHLLYYQNIGRPQRVVGETIGDDINNTIKSFDINEKIRHSLENYLTKDNNKGPYITPSYRDNGYEVAFINSNGQDLITEKALPPFAENITNASNNVSQDSVPEMDDYSEFLEEMDNDCGIPDDGGLLIFDINDSGMPESPWLKSLKCRREKTISLFRDGRLIKVEWPISLQNILNNGISRESIGQDISYNFGLEEFTKYAEQLSYLDNDTSNQNVLNNASAEDYQKLDKILSYTKIVTDKNNVNADEASGSIKISSTVELDNVDFYIKNVGTSKIKLLNGTTVVSHNITEGSTSEGTGLRASIQGTYSTGEITFDPFYDKELNFEIQNPIAGRNVVVFYMCLPGTTDIAQCVTKTLTLEIIPGKVNNLEMLTQGTTVLQGSKFPITIKGTDKFGNNVGQIFDGKFQISTSDGTLSYESSMGKQITFSNFNKSNFILNVDENATDNSQIHIEVQGTLAGTTGLEISKTITVKRGILKISQGGLSRSMSELTSININLPSVNEYSYKDSYNLNQTNLNKVPSIKIKLQSTDGQNINIETTVSVSSKNKLVKPGEIETRKVTKTQDGNTFEVTQNRFSQTNDFIIENGELEVYLMPTFKAGDDIISISIPGIETLNIPLTVNPAPAKIVDINTQKDMMSVNSSLQAKLKISDNRGNVITRNAVIRIGSLGPLSISGTNTSGMGGLTIRGGGTTGGNVVNVLVKNGQLDFILNAKEKGGYGFVFAQIMSGGVEVEGQKPGAKEIIVQDKLLPDENLNIMYLNLFGNDWGNQRGFMSDNNKYVQNLINNSEKLITTTTQLINPENIKMFSVIMSKKIEFINIENKEISFELNNATLLDNGLVSSKGGSDNSLKFKIKDVGEIKLNINNFNLQEIAVSEENLETVITTMVNNSLKNKNTLIYIPEATDSIIESNEVENNTIIINNENVFNLKTAQQNLNLSISLSNEKIAGYQAWELNLGNKKIGTFLFVINKVKDLTVQVQSNNLEYDYRSIWIDGSTNKEGIGFFQSKSKFPKGSLGYKSIQDSYDPALGIGFTNDFKNITNFGAGESVGEATVNFSSEFLINIGDPLLRRIDNNENSKLLDTDLNLELDSGFDQGIGEVIFSDTDKTILKAINIDFNNDGFEDIIVAFTDGSIKILKNYGGNTPFKDLGDVMILADGIKEIIVGDVDGNGYKDIIIKNNSDILRVYKNDRGVFDVDGLPICINTNVKSGIKSETPQNISGVNQIFFEDMDNDGVLDIVTNDSLGYIKIFYGGQTNGKDNYVSDDKTMCDDGWYNRQNNITNRYSITSNLTSNANTNTVYRFGIRVNENTKVLDQSLVHWEGLNQENIENESVEIDPSDVGIDTSAFSEDNLDDIFNKDKGKLNEDKLNATIDAGTTFDVGVAEKEYQGMERYKLANFGVIPLYENDVEDESEIPYVEIGCLTGEDPIKIYKKYEDINGDVLENGDKVQVTVVLQANKTFKGTFIDRISGPWIIPLTGDMNRIENFWFEPAIVATQRSESGMRFHWDMKKSRYMIDNISMKAGDEIRINYWVFYNGETETHKIDIKDVDGNDYEKFGGNNGEKLTNRPKDGLKDIKVVPTDGCNKSLFILFNNNQGDKKTYSPEYVDLANILARLTNKIQENFENAMSQMSDALTDNVFSSNSVDLENVPGAGDFFNWEPVNDIWDETFSLENIVNGDIDLDDLLSIPADIIDGLAGDTMKKVDKIMGKVCNGLKLSDFGVGGEGNCGLPVPFNQAFLGPGEYHLFGCFKEPLIPVTETLGKGLPVFTVPGNWLTTVGYLPIPGIFGFPYKGPSDGFLGLSGGPNNSLFRIYVMPTLTAEIGIAMCFANYNEPAIVLPDPFGTIAGNCLVFAFPLPCKEEGGSIAQAQPNVTEKVPEVFLDIDPCSSQNVPCYIGTGESTSSFEFVSSSSNSYNMNSAIPDGSYAGGFINIEATPVTEYGYQVESANIEIEGIKLFGGADSQNKILGGDGEGGMKEIVKKRAERQVDYILNNLTNFKLNIILPDFEGMVSDFKEVRTLTEAEKCENKGMKRNKETKTCEKRQKSGNQDKELGKLAEWSQDNLVSREQITDLSKIISNPFVTLEQMFKEVRLINIQTENITVKVPIITSDDIVAYISMAKNWIEKQKKVLEKWFDLFKALVGRCGGEDTESIKNRNDLKNAIKGVKAKLKAQINEELKSVEEQINDIQEQIDAATDPDRKKELEEEKKKLESQKDGLKQDVENISKQITQIKDLSKRYDLNDFQNYEIFESCTAGEFFIRPEKIGGFEILPFDIYISYKPNTNANEELSVFTKGFDLIKTKTKGKTKISIKENGKDKNNEGLCLKRKSFSTPNQCVELFLGGKLDNALNNFLNIQSNTQLLIQTIRQNIETLELYKKFPIELYERIHVGERYRSDISSLLNGVLGTLSMWMKTNATRYSQYVDAIILILTTLETYQVIIDISKDWSEKCGTCTNDEYDQINCKLGNLCDANNFPILEIPPFKIPSIFLDFSRINLGVDITLPKFNFVPTSVPLPKLPNLPEPPSLDISLDMEEALGMGIDLVGKAMESLGLSVSPSIPAMPIIPAPPKLPEIPSFIPTVRLELPVLPPAPKIPKLPNTIKGTIKMAETIGKVLCLVKKPVGLVKEKSIKARIEQMTQRTYEVPYWDNKDKTLEQRKSKTKGKIPDRISDIYPFLMSSEFQNVQLKGFDIGVESFVDLQFNLDGAFDIINGLVNKVNEISTIPGEWAQGQIDKLDEESRTREKRMTACVTRPASEECLGDLYTGEVKRLKEETDEKLQKITNIGNNIRDGFAETKKAMLLIEEQKNNRDNLNSKKQKTEDNIEYIEQEIELFNLNLESTTKEDEIIILNRKISEYEEAKEREQKKLEEQIRELEKIESKLRGLKNKYDSQIEVYVRYLSGYAVLNEQYLELKEEFAEVLSGVIADIRETIGSGQSSGQQILNSLQFEDIDKRNAEIEEKMNKMEIKQDRLKEQRYESLGDLYKEIGKGISYVDYDKNTYNENMRNLKDGLNTILTKSNNETLNKKVEDLLDIIDSKQENIILDASKKIQNLEKQYYSILSEFQKSNNDLSNLIEKDYDKFLYAVANNDISLVSDQDFNISLSSNLFEMDKVYMSKFEELVNNYYEKQKNRDIIETNLKTLKTDDKILLSQNNSNNNNQTNNNGGSSTVDISQYVNVIKTPEGSINLANQDYVTSFQDSSIMTDLNGDNKQDLILRDSHNVYVKYRDGNRNYQGTFNNESYNNKYYKYSIDSYEQLFNNGEEGFIKINQIYLKMYDENWAVKNFKHNGSNFDNIKVSWSNSKILGDEVDGYLVKMIHRVDLFNDKENIITNNNRKFFNKKYMLVVPEGMSLSGLKIGLEEGIFDIESLLTGVIWDILYYNESEKTIGLTITEIPRNWQYSQIYTLNKENDLYYISSPASNQSVGGPQIVSDENGPDVNIKVFRPSIQDYIDEGTNFDLYVSTKYTISSERVDGGGIKKLWIADSAGNIIKEKNDVNSTTGYLELSGLYFTGVGIKNYYFVGLDNNGNTSSNEITLNIRKPDIEIIDMEKHGSGINNPVTINAEINHDVDEAYVQFLRNRHGIWEILTGTMGGVKVDKYRLQPQQTSITGGYYDMGDDIGLYLASGSLAAKINPKNGKISIENGFEDIITIELDYLNRIPIVKILDDKGATMFSINLSSRELISLDTTLDTIDLYGDEYGDFNNGKVVMYNDEVLLYVSPKGQIYTEELLYGDYKFDNNTESVVYSFRTSKLGQNLGTIKIKIKNLLVEEEE